MGGNDFGPLVIERGNPIVETCRRTRNTPAINACHFEEIPQLPIGQLDEQIGQKTATRLLMCGSAKVPLCDRLKSPIQRSRSRQIDVLATHPSSHSRDGWNGRIARART